MVGAVYCKVCWWLGAAGAEHSNQCEAASANGASSPHAMGLGSSTEVLAKGVMKYYKVAQCNGWLQPLQAD